LIDAVILGGETGPGARPMHPDWVRSVRDQCQDAGVPFYFKGWGEWAPISTVDGTQILPFGDYLPETGFGYKRNREKHRLLDGEEHNDLPWRTA